MKARSIIVSGVFIIIAAFCGTNVMAASVRDAEGFMKAGQYKQAAAVLEGITSKSPGNTNALAQYELGICYSMLAAIENGQAYTSMAEERFKSAIKLDPKYGHKIAGIFEQAGKDAISMKRFSDARILYRKAVEYQPALQQKIADQLYKDGERFVLSGMRGEEDGRFMVAGSLSAKTADQICKLYTNLGDKADDDSCPLFYMKGRDFCQGYNEKTGQRLIAIAQKLAKQPGREEQTKLYKQVAAIFVGDQFVENQIPSTVKLNSNTYHDFDLGANEQSPWLEIGYGTFKFSHDENALYKIVFENGAEYSMSQSLPEISQKIRVIALKKSYVRIIFNKK